MRAESLPSPAPAPAPAAAELSQQRLQFLRFTSGTQACALRIDAVREILEVAHLTPLPLVPEFVRGVMNLRGAVVPVFDLGVRLGLPAIQIGRRSCIVVVDVVHEDVDSSGEQTLGLLVDAVHEVFDCGADELEAVPRMGTRVPAGFLRSMVRSRGQATPELDLATTLDLAMLNRLIDAHVQPH